MPFLKHIETSYICVIVEGEVMSHRVCRLLDRVSIYLTEEIPQDLTKDPFDDEVVLDWRSTFKNSEFQEYWILSDKDYHGAAIAGNSFIAIRKYHPQARIFDCRIEFGAASDALDGILTDFYSHAIEIDGTGETIEQLLEVWNGDEIMEIPENFDENNLPRTGALYLQHLKKIRRMHWLKSYEFSFEWGHRGELKLTILKLLLEKGQLKLNLIKELVYFVHNYQRGIKINRMDRFAIPRIFDELSDESLPLIQGLNGINPFKINDYEERIDNYRHCEYFLNQKLFDLVFKDGLENPPILPMGAFMGTREGNPQKCPKIPGNIIMDWLINACNGTEQQVPTIFQDEVALTDQNGVLETNLKNVFSKYVNSDNIDNFGQIRDILCIKG